MVTIVQWTNICTSTVSLYVALSVLKFYNFLSERKCNQLNFWDLGCTTPQITVDYDSIPMWWRHVGILLSKTPTLYWMWSSGALIQVSAL